MYAWFKETLVEMWGVADDPRVCLIPEFRKTRARRLLIRRVALVFSFWVAGMLGMAFGAWAVT